MNPGQLVALVVIVGGGYWLVTGVNPLSLLGLDTSGIDRYIDPRVAAASQTLARQQQLDAATAQQRSGRAGYAITTGGAGTAAGIATTAGLASSTVLLATGIGAAAGLLVWGIVQKGWFRGGEEGIRVNPARNDFLNEFVKVYYPQITTVGNDHLLVGNVSDPVTGYSGDAQYAAMVRAFHDANINGNVADQTITQLYAADTMEEFNVAAQNFLAVLQSGVH